MADRTVSVGLRADVGGFIAGIRTAQKSVSDFTRDLEKNAKRKQALLDIGNAAGAVGLAAAAGVGVAIKAAADFDKAMSGVQAATHAPQAEMSRLRELALQMGADTAFSAGEAADGITQMAKAGVSTRDIMGGGLKGALSLAAAGEMEVGDAAETAATAMTMFGLKGQDLPHVADLLAAAAGKAQGEVSDFSMALNQSGLVAHQTGLTIEETTGALAAFASQGLIGSDAGTSLKTALQSLTPSSTKAKELMDELGISAYDSQGNFIGLAKYAGVLRDGLADMSDEQRNAALKTIFGSDAVRAASVIYEEGARGIGKWIGKVDDAGFAAETASIKMDNLAGDLEEFKGSLETALIGVGSGAQGPLRNLVQGATKLVNAFNDLPGPVKQATLAFGGLAAVLGGGTFLGARFIAGISDGREALRNLRGTTVSATTSATSARGGFGRFATFLTGPWGIALAGGALAIGALMKANADAEEKVVSLTRSLNRQTGAVTRNTAEQVINAAQQQGLYAKATKLGISSEMLTRALLGERDALAEVNRRLNASVDANSEWVSTGLTSAKVSTGLGREAQQLRLALDNQSGALAEATNRWRQNKKAQELSHNVLGRTRDLWDQSTSAMGRASDGANKLTGDIKNIPDKHSTKVEADTAKARRDVESFTGWFNGVMTTRLQDEDVKINVSSSILKLAAQGQGPIREFATGGPIAGGAPGRDSVPAMLTPGEHVFTKSDVDKAGGQRAMFAIRKMIQNGEFARKGDLQYYANGGPVVRMPVREQGLDSVVSTINSRVDALAAAYGKRLSEQITQMYQFGGGRPLGPGGSLSQGQIVKGQQFARSQAGKPYQWGGVGNPSWDCSGFVGGVLLAAMGRSPYQRIGTTASMPWPGFSPGAGTFTTGTDPGSHMDGNIGGLGIESRGGDGIVLGSGITPIGSFARVDHYDTGGVWPHGTVGVNMSGRDELVLTDNQARRFFGVGGGGGGGSRSPQVVAGRMQITNWRDGWAEVELVMEDKMDGRARHAARVAGMR